MSVTSSLPDAAIAPAVVRRQPLVPATCLAKWSTALICFAALCICTQVQAQYRPYDYERPTLFEWRAGEASEPADEPDVIIADRPDFTNAPVTVGQGVQQVEFGYTYNWSSSGGPLIASHSYPEALLRLGMFEEWFEFRLQWDYSNVTQPAGGHVQHLDGAQDLYIGAKIALTPQTGALPATAIMPQMTLPTGADAFTAHKAMPGVAFLYAWDITDWLSLGGSTQVNQFADTQTGNDYAQWAQSFSFGYGLTETTNAFTEWYVIAPARADTDRTMHYLNGGFSHRLNDNLQVDIRIGKGVSEADPGWFTGAGAAFRF